MTKSSWHILRDDKGLTLARQMPPRFDVQSETVLAKADPLRLAHQIRQDMWRALQNMRGFSPVVRVETRAEYVKITAGGRVEGRVPTNAAEQIAEVLENPGNRARWLRHARLRGGRL
ncbi:hypothetical protein [Sulfitobacter pontiacus]|uniref:hypothetical protein n=1 Tax=Sulfitobacter pontiacus TaxID=60137 RepID=UPI003263AAA4